MSDPIALSLANAELRSAADLDRWLRTSGDTAEHAGELSLRLGEFGDLRACLRELLAAAADGRPLPADAVERLNDASARIPRIARLESGEVNQVPVGAGPAPLVLALIAWSAMNVLGGPDRERIRRCGACGRFFIATRPDRVWCSDRCGNRIRVARHHARLLGRT
ncbi:MAG TPA: CGNR zinc finger domain-containing protein [Actinomycetota bacterium]|nr:CGNR zinc finger domain-containing protein [Actinomycetota bacterium]